MGCPRGVYENKKGGVHNMTNEDIVKAIQNGFDVTENMQWLYQKNLPLIKIMIRPFTLYENEEDLLQEAYFGLWEAVQRYETSENVLFMTYAGFLDKAGRKTIYRKLRFCN
jgi:DNA-directed RNA polymerase specialized sigma subunit